MKIGIIGAGRIGANAARLFARAGHEVVISNSRGPETLSGIVEEIGNDTRAVTIEEAADFGDVVLEAIPFGRYEELPADHLADKIVIDASNYYPRRDGGIDLGGLTSTEAVARHLPDSRVVKAFNTMYYERLANEGRPGFQLEKRQVLFVAGDDEEAKGIVSRLIEEIGFAPVDTGSLKDSYLQEPGSSVYNNPMTPERAHEMLAGSREERR
ncbi:MAG TPA: NADPH-dependent F420 reductase [Rubrobacter sp.]|nr:NADPH-dependent F420 reductase [Rubrobacter sp.]